MELTITREDMGIRLVEERTRLGYSQADFAHQTEVSRETLRLNETGRSGISAEFLGRAAELGLDVQYVITGIKSKTAHKPIEQSQSAQVQGEKNNVIFGDGSTINNITTEKIVKKQKL